MRTAVIETDAGTAYAKCMGNPVGEHALVCELVGTSMASLLGLPTFQVAVLDLDAASRVELETGKYATSGPAFVSKQMRGEPWGGDPETLRFVANPTDFTGLVACDTWLLNEDRYPRLPNSLRAREAGHLDNVFLSPEGCAPGTQRLVAFDFSHALVSGREITRRLADIDSVQDEGVYGLWPSWRPYVAESTATLYAKRLGSVPDEAISRCLAAVPTEWSVTSTVREAVSKFLRERKRWLSEALVDLLRPYCFPQRQMDLHGGEEKSNG